eukprot:CAMPEP_0204840318 /NCGR_PEP_ID=MMETSP1346-20131115/37255_1 /ASSEMBLY_ACC=CAM_ASM_000771 /TAXON_ID=215587 /ORGANISM="Aplanochytrium stocchinoi, Strain GSBS06" /LENGTH=54 /DNA_ID=CAMNT_0051977623 /DNA_START=350 /DNA_END=511 /DNA_ORIENTATION=+
MSSSNDRNGSFWEKMWTKLAPGEAFDAEQPLPYLERLLELDFIPKDGVGIGMEK